MLRDYTPPFDATVVDILRREGAHLAGKTNLDEFGMGSLNAHSAFGPVTNPFNSAVADAPRHAAGGSSGGSAAAVAAGLCDAALGTDTGGSVRLPASYCGVVGLKPSYGMLSRWGVISYADSLDCVGILGKDVETTLTLFDTISQYDPKDPTSASDAVRRRAKTGCDEHMSSWAKGDNLTGLRVGVPQEYFPASLSEEVQQRLRDVLKALREAGAELVPVSLPNTKYALSAYYVLASAEASSNLARYDGVQYGLQVPPQPHQIGTVADTYALSRTAGFGPEVQKRILLGAYALSAEAFDNYFLKAQRLRNLIREDFRSVFSVPDPLIDATSSPSDGVHVLLHPSAIRTAPLLPDATEAEVEIKSDGAGEYVQDVLTVPASLAGLPAVSVPAPCTGDQWPIGVSVVGQWGCEEMVLRVAHAIEDISRP
ncbi:unnamed protein product [Peniophora sp. CBMAI 1063]|nr:unnamed protein product [Peniophora sp. CBMAI 1063]